MREKDGRGRERCREEYIEIGERRRAYGGVRERERERGVG